ncbi:hypothetical protein [Saccharospirillum impatiens]|uniref:hypothetical protein n=1 Tax=Saccharospirillum impatiens TaxID=169438 RepID=UPI00041F177F|nr:hypothetical protein [Saccharospirillum impatiens]
MDQKDPQQSLLKDLEDIRQSLDRIVRPESQIPLLDEIVDKRSPTHVNPDNPFLSSQSLSELIRIRNEAEARAAEELASLAPLRPITEIVHSEQQRQAVVEPPKPPPAPDPEQVLAQLETVFDHWIDDTVANYLTLFERDLRNRLQQDFRTLVSQWYEDNDLPVPTSFKREDPADPSTPDD